MSKRGPKISPKIRELITLRALEEPRIPRDAVATRLIDEIERMGLLPPSEETIVKMVSQARNQEQNPLDTPWSISCVGRYNFPLDSISILIALQKLQKNVEYEAPRERPTIRQAQWIARLHSFILEMYIRKYGADLDENKRPKNKEYLWMVYIIADMYAQMEKVSEVTKVEQDTQSLDELIFISERFWNMSNLERANYYAASRILQKAVFEDYGHRISNQKERK